MLARVLLLGLLALVGPSFSAWASGPIYSAPGGGSVTAKTCSAGDFFSAVDGSGNFTCSTAGSGSGDVTDVGDCATGACFTGSSGTTLTFKNATSGTIAVTPVAGALGTKTINLPAENGTVCTTGSVCSGYQASGSYADILGTPADNRVAVWTDANTLEGSAGFTFDSGTNTVTATTFSGNASTATALSVDPTACTANKFVTDVSTGGAGMLTCTQPAFSDISGTASAAQLALATLLAGRSGTGNDTTLSTSATGTLYGSTVTANDLTLRSNSADTTTGEINLNAPRIDIYPSFPASSTATLTLMQFGATSTLSGSGANLATVSSVPALTVADTIAMTDFKAGGTLDRTGTTGSTLYATIGFNYARTHTSSTTGGPLFQDAFEDNSISEQSSGTATQNTYQPISFLSKPTFRAASGATLTIGQTTGVDLHPTWGATGGTFTNTTYSAVRVHPPCDDPFLGANSYCNGTPTLTNYIGLDVEDLFETSAATQTTYTSLRSVGTTTDMRHAGPARFGATGAPTSGKKLDVQGDTLITGAMDVGDNVADPGASSTTKIIDVNDTIDTPNNNGGLSIFSYTGTSAQSESNNIIGIDLRPTINQSGSVKVPTFYGLNMGGTSTATSGNFPVSGIVRNARTYTSATASALPVSNLTAVVNAPTVSHTASSGSSTVTTVAGMQHTPTVSTGAANTLTVTNDTALLVDGTYTQTAGTLTVTNRRGLVYNAPSVTSAAVTNNIAVDIAAQTAGSTLIAGVRSAIASGSNNYFLKDDGGAQSKFTGKITTYNNIATAGFGLPIIVADSGVSATKTANFTSTSFTPPATAGAYRGSWIVTTTSGTNTGTVQCTIDYVDSQGTTHTADIIPMAGAAGTFGTTGTAASKQFRCGPWPLNINNSATAIAMKVVITGSVNYTVQTILEQTS